IFMQGGTLTFNNDYTLRSLLTLSWDITVRSGTDTPYTVTRGVGGNLITYGGDRTLTLENIIIDGNKENFPNPGGSLIRMNNSTLNVGDTVVANNNAESSIFVADNNSESNIFLTNNRYITLSTTNPLVAGSRIGVTKTDNDGVFVQNGASADNADYFFSDDLSKCVVFDDGALSVTDHTPIVENCTVCGYSCGTALARTCTYPPCDFHGTPTPPSDGETWDFTNRTANASDGAWSWNNATKTLTLTDLIHATTATPALRLPDGATIVSAGGTSTITSSGSTAIEAIGTVNIHGRLTVESSDYGVYGNVVFHGGEFTAANINSSQAVSGTITVNASGYRYKMGADSGVSYVGSATPIINDGSAYIEITTRRAGLSMSSAVSYITNADTPQTPNINPGTTNIHNTAEGWTWEHAHRILTLHGAYINGNLTVPNGTTIILADGSHNTVTGTVPTNANITANGGNGTLNGEISPSAGSSIILSRIGGPFTVGEQINGEEIYLSYKLLNGIFADSINTVDFHAHSVLMPLGVSLGTAWRTSDTEVRIPFVGTPTIANTASASFNGWTNPIPAVNFVGATAPVQARTVNNAFLTIPAINKGTGAEVSGAPTADSVTHNSITVNALTIPTNPSNQVVQYAISTDGSVTPTTGWQTTLTFTELGERTTYYVYARSMENANRFAGAIQVSVGITTACSHSSRNLSDCTACYNCSETLDTHNWSAWVEDGVGCIRTCQNTCEQTETHATDSNNANNTNCTANSVCVTCDRVLTAAGNHDVGGSWLSDNTNHWQKCQNNNCTHTGNQAAHISDNVKAADCTVDSVCTVCNYVMEAANSAHTPKDEDCKQCQSCTTVLSVSCTISPKCEACQDICDHSVDLNTNCTECTTCGKTGLTPNCADTCTACLCEHFMPSDWTVRIAPTCTTTGLEVKECEHDCGHEETQPIPELGHIANDTCSDRQCGRIINGLTCTQNMTGLGHDYTVAANCTEPARCVRFSDCGSTDGVALGHIPNDTCVDRPCGRGSCTVNMSGLEHSPKAEDCTACYNCSANLGTHTFPAWSGTQARKCDNCAFTETDNIAPTGTINVSTNAFTSFLNTITFGLFFKNTVEITVTGADEGGSGVAAIEYLITEMDYANAEAMGSVSWTNYNGAITHTTPGNAVVYAKITDNAGNVTIIRSDGFVIFTQVATPTASPNGGTFSGSTSVTLSTATAGATIYYTTNGTTPTASSTQYTGAFTINATTTVRAIAVMADMDDSEILTVTFTRQTSGGNGTTPPETTTTPPTTTTTPPTTITTPPTTTGTEDTPPPIVYYYDDFINGDVVDEILDQDNPTIIVTDLDGKIISATVLQAIRESGIDVTVVLPNGFVFTIIADSITPEASAFDLDIEVITTSRATAINGVNVPANSIVINPNFSGEFGFEIAFKFTSQQLSEAGVNGNNVKLFHVNYTRNVTDLGRVRLNTDGSAEFTISSASFYVLSAEAPLNTQESNPRTGVAIGFAAVSFAGIVTLASRKRRKYNKQIKM
ncbi:MAG: chitobiase/beta-hexosaminidase C-terminal domain-containing protein, partial [Oscillospiraceae bacterium]|nr:chitobiase/beta-hexosaminidase C-terminal domain-containing protein [Oscillospiraceae bacterium]